jgi:multidrug efflux system membrane fusion protein
VFGAPDVMVRSLKLGAPLGITTAPMAGEIFTGRVSLIAPLADPRSRVFDVEVTIPNADDRLKVGMVASLQVEEAGAASAPLVVGLGSIVRDKSRPDGYAVFVLDAAAGAPVVKRRSVSLGQAFGNWIAVTSGLAEGERVVTSGATLVTDGARVTVAER